MGSNRSVAALAAVRDRVARHISVPVSDAEALKIGFTCAIVESDALLELSHTRVVQAEANAHRRELAITADEFAVLLDDNSLNATRRLGLTNALSEDEQDPARQAQSEAVRGALRLTLNERTQHELWKSNPRVRMRAMLAMLREDDHVACLEHALGEVLKSDHRRIDDMRSATEEEGIDIMSVAQLISTTCTGIGT